jgi:radical SAM enzyme (TIGR01210 family)
MVECVRQGLATLPHHIWHLLCSPSGSLLDTWEVPEQAREGILALMGATSYETFSFETRAETITDQVTDQCLTALGGRGLKIYIGLESADPWISKYCINKELSLDEFVRATGVLRSHQVGVTANVLLGSPFLTAKQAIEDAVRTTNWAFSVGVTECCLFPTNVKKWTSLHWLYEQGLYTPPSLWSLVEVLHRLDRGIVASQIELAWYTSYGAFNVVAAPTTCSACEQQVLAYLHHFAETNDYEDIEQLAALECRCKDVWRALLEASEPAPLITRTAATYERIGRELIGQNWWLRNHQKVLSALHADMATSAYNAD